MRRFSVLSFALAAVATVTSTASAQATATTPKPAAAAPAAAKPAAAQPPASPRDSLTATISGATITVNYGRPSKRGRVLFGGLADMQWGMVWRTGANEATHFTTSKPLMFGSAVVPAGTYTLYTHLVQSGKWELVINRQTKQWGTVYDEKQDLVRVPLTVTSTNPVMEKMTITVTPSGTNGVLTIAWDSYKAATTFMVH
jgi:cytochrome c5